MPTNTPPAITILSMALTLAISLGTELTTQRASAADGADAGKPNIVLIFTDDLGYGDIPGFGPSEIRTPNIDKLAQQGTRFTDYYVAQAVCTASRAALMTGCYANRVGLAGALNHKSKTGINPKERLLPEILKDQGYATGMFGKWHLGLSPYFSPLKNGFDEWLGIPYSNDNTKYHPVLFDSMPPLPLFDGDEIIEEDPDQRFFTQRLTRRAVKFIDSHKDQPFFLYIPHVMPHVPVFASPEFDGRSGKGIYTDVIEEIDWSVGQIVDAIDRHGLAENTLVIFTSDNGPFLSYGTHAGSSKPLREGKLTCFEGGVRVPTIMRMTGKVPEAATCSVPIMSIDLLPTACKLSGAPLPDAILDGVDVSDVLFGKTTEEPHECLVFYSGSELHAIRAGKWKLHFPHKYLTPNEDLRSDGKPAGFGKLKPQPITQSGVEGIASRHGYYVRNLPLSLYDLSSDAGEQRDVSKQHPEVVERLTKLANAYRQKLGDSLTSIQGGQLRPVGRNDQ